MTACTAAWRETNPNVGDEINADFTWQDAVWHMTGEFYCDMAVYDPTGERRAYYVEEEWNEGSHTLTINFANIPGEWVCTIRVWDGSAFVECNDYVLVSAGQTLCSANWRETNPEVGETINVDFTWSNARVFVSPEYPNGIYCSMGIYDPDGILVDSYDETTNETGSYTLSVAADVAGNWTCLIAAWTGFAWLYASDIVYVSPQSGECIGNIWDAQSAFYTGPFPPGTNQLVAEIAWGNSGELDGCMVTMSIYEYPGESNQHRIGLHTDTFMANEWKKTDIYADIPESGTEYPLGVKVWAPAYENEPSW